MTTGNINEMLLMQSQGVDTATPIRQAQADSNRNAESAQRVLQGHLQNLDQREKMRLQSTITGAVQLKQFLDGGDAQGALNFLTQRKSELTQRMSAGEPVDTQDTDAALQMLQTGNIDELRNNVDGLIAAGQVYGIVNTQQSGAGGNTGVLLDRLVKEQHAAGNTNYTLQDALRELKGGAGQTGRNMANIESGFDANFQTQSGSNASDLAYKPQIQQAQNEAGVLGTREGESKADFAEFAAAVPALEKTVNKLWDVADMASANLSGRALDVVQRELGFDPGNDAQAREYYTNTVRTEILPILKQTFGAQFTEKEGQWLLSTLGDINKAPNEKRAALQARVDSWRNMYDTMARRAGQQPQQTFENFPPQHLIRVRNPQTGETFDIQPDDLQDAEAEGFMRQ